MEALKLFLFIGLPYTAIFVLIAGTIYRYRKSGFSVSSLSSQFLEGRKLFWGSMPFHWGVMFIFFGHLIAFLFPSSLLAWNAHPVRLLVIEISAFMFGLSMLAGLVGFINRRMGDKRVKMVSSWMDYTVLGLLLVQVVLGLSTAYFLRWGSSWFASTLTPYIWSLMVFQPDISAIGSMHWLIQAHVVGAYLILIVIPFSRLIHFLVLPIAYIWRPYQRVIWYWNRKSVRNPDSVWTPTKPKNN
jgi:nitrate reductase gamma subunit